MEVIFEIVFQAVFQFIAEGIIRWADTGLLNPRVRATISAVLGVGVGFGAGWWWGDRLSDVGRVDPPRALYVSIALAALFFVLAIVNALRQVDETLEGSVGARLRGLVTPWRWGSVRLMSYALMNSAAALGISIGFLPDPLR